MKKDLIILLIVFLPCISALELNIHSEQIQPYETLTADLTTDFINQISPDQVKFFELRKQVYFDYDLIYYNNTYYFYFIFHRQGNFTIKINNILYREDGILKTTTIEKNVSIANSENSKILSIKPGVILTSNFSEITFSNKGKSNLDFSYNQETYTLIPNEIKKIKIFPQSEFSLISISSYKNFIIPSVFYPIDSIENETDDTIEDTTTPTTPDTTDTTITNSTNTTITNSTNTSQTTTTDNTSEINETNIIQELLITPNNLTINLIQNKNQTHNISITSSFKENLTITLKHNLSILSIPEEIIILPNSTQNLSLKFFPSIEIKEEKNLTIEFTYNNTTNIINIPIIVFVYPENLEDIKPKTQNCSELRGTICPQSQSCEGQAVLDSQMKYCCLGECKTISQPKEPTNYKWIIGIIVILVVGGAGFFIYSKYKKTSDSKPEEKFKKSSKLYENRLKGSLSRV